jgi:deazaflavin-dependent oxidoreductase (nitroreductase family)
MSDWNDKIIKEFRQNDGAVGGRYQDMQLLLLHTKGAKTGKERVNPVVTIEDGEDQIIVASKGGATDNPDWFYNLEANPRVTVELGSHTYQAQAVVLQEPERTHLFNKMVDQHPFFQEYQDKTERTIPVIRLEALNA